MTNISTPKPKLSQGGITFDFDPHVDGFDYVIGGNTYGAGFYGAVDSPLQFQAAVSLPSGRTPVEYQWDFGDGTKGSDNPVEHTYSVANLHIRVALTVIDNEGTRYHVAKQIYLTTDESPGPR